MGIVVGELCRIAGSGLCWQRQSLIVELIAHKSLHLGHQRLEVSAFLSTNARELLKQDIEVLFTLNECCGSVAGCTLQDVCEAARNVGQLLLLDEWVSVIPFFCKVARLTMPIPCESRARALAPDVISTTRLASSIG